MSTSSGIRSPHGPLPFGTVARGALADADKPHEIRLMIRSVTLTAKRHPIAWDRWELVEANGKTYLIYDAITPDEWVAEQQASLIACAQA